MKAAAFLMVAGLLAASAESAGLQSAELRAELTYGRATDGTSLRETGVELEPAVSLALGDNSELVLSGRLRWDRQDWLTPGTPDTDTYTGLSRPWIIGSHAVAELRDAYLQLDLGKGILRLGKQQIAWGTLDGLKINDALNPQSFREFILEDFAASRIGLWSIYADTTLGDWRAELALIPDTTGHEIPGDGAWFELRAPRFRYGAAPDTSSPPTTTIRPGAGLDEPAVGLRVSRLVGRWDLALLAVSGMDFEPLGRLASSPTGTVLERYYDRRTLFGISTATSLGAVALRTEWSFRPGRAFNRRDGTELAAERLDQYVAGFGVDINGPLSTFINLQYVIDHVQSAPDSLVRPATDRLATLLLRREFAYDTVTAELRWYRDIDHDDELIRAALSYVVGAETTLRFGIDMFRGKPDGLFGQFADRDRITLGVEHYF